MTIAINNKPIPLETKTNGVIYVAGTRVTLDTVVATFNEGATAEEIVYEYPSLNLPDVYSVISYYLREQSKVDAYRRKRRLQASEIRKQNEARFDPQSIRDRLIARRKKPSATQ